jgi:dipeptide transport system permease protein
MPRARLRPADHHQYSTISWGVLHGDFGTSISTKQAGAEAVHGTVSGDARTVALRHHLRRRPRHSGRHLAAVKRGSIFDQIVMGTALIGYSMPIFWWGLLLIILFSVSWQWTPVSGRISLMYFFPPVTGFMLVDSLLSGQAGAFKSALQPPDPADDRARHHSARGDRAPDPLGDARSAGRGLRPHGARQGPVAAASSACMRCATRMIPVVTTIGLQVGVMLAGAILTERSSPGRASASGWSIRSSGRDYPVMQGGLLLIAGLIMLVNLIVDLLYGLINPRIRH